MKLDGYKSHAKVDTKNKLINHREVTDAVHDSQALDDLLTEGDAGQPLYADSAYRGEAQEKVIEKYGMNSQVNEKGYRNNPLTDKQKASNKEKSKTRARMGRVFGFMEQSMNGLALGSVRITGAKGIVGLIDLTYNLFRHERTIRLSAV